MHSLFIFEIFSMPFWNGSSFKNKTLKVIIGHHLERLQQFIETPCVPQPSSDGDSWVGFAHCEHGKKVPGIPLETPASSVPVSLCFCSLRLSASCIFSSIHVHCPECLFEKCVGVLPVLCPSVRPSVYMSVCLYVYMCTVYMSGWCPQKSEESIRSTDTGVKDSWAAMGVLGTGQGPLQSTL